MAESEDRKGMASTPGAMTVVFVFFLLSGVLAAAYTGRTREVSDASFQAAKDSVSLALGLIGVMAFWLGMMRVLEVSGMVNAIARSVRPLMIKLFPDVPPDHPAMGAMVMNVAANMLGLGNAATPFGLRAMVELNRLNPLPGTATNAMCLFLAINTSSITVLPLGVIGLRASAGSAEPASIFLPSLFATTISTVVGIIVALLLAKRDRSYRESLTTLPVTAESPVESDDQKTNDDHLRFIPNPGWSAIAAVAVFGLLGGITLAAYRAESLTRFFVNDLFSFWLMPTLILLIVSYGVFRGVKVYEAVTEGAKQGFDIAVKIIPFLVAILVSISVFRASGAMDGVAMLLQPVTGALGLPLEALPMAILRPLSGTGAFGILSEIVQRAPDSYEAFVSSVMMGATDTTFYILAVYFGSVGVVRVRHAVVAGLAADIAGMVAAALLSPIFFSA